MPRAPRATAADGFTLVELMVALVVMSIVMGGVAGYFISLRRAVVREDMTSTLEAQLRIGMDLLVTNLRSAGYGVPRERLALWVPWVEGFSENPLVVGDAPDTLTVASCTPEPVATLASGAAAGATAVVLRSTSSRTLRDQLNAAGKRLIRIGEDQFAHVTATPADSATATVSIDTEPDPSVSSPPAAANPGLKRPFVAGTPVCRVDVRTYSVDPAARVLRMNAHQGSGSQPVVGGITDLRITGRQGVTLTGRSARTDPESGQYLVRTLMSGAGGRNP